MYVLPEEVDVGDCVVLLFGDSFLERGLVLFSVFVSVLIVFRGMRLYCEYFVFDGIYRGGSL